MLVDRCIACGNCIKVCPQHAKKILDGIGPTFTLLSLSRPSIAVLAPSFAAAFENIQPGQIIAGLRQLGFSEVLEVAFGADMVSQAYSNLLQSGIMPTIISSPCPAIVNYIEKYYPHLKIVLAPVVSPMIAIGRAIKQHYCPDAFVVFVGPCVAKKSEMRDPSVVGAIDQVLTFNELEQMFEERNIDIADLQPSNFDGPKSGLGKTFPISRGLLKCTNREDDILDCQVVATEGRDRVLELLTKVNTGDIEATFLDVLFCRGCIKGPMMANEDSVFVRKDRIVNYIKSIENENTEAELKQDLVEFSTIDLKRRFVGSEISQNQPTEVEIVEILHHTGKTKPEEELNCGACGYATCREKAVAVFQGLAEAEMCLPFMLEKFEKMQVNLSASNTKLRRSLASLRHAQRQLVQSEKLASVGRLAAGVAHELNNPLGGILLYSNILLNQLKSSSQGEAMKKVVAETERCRRIVKGLLDFSQQGAMQKEKIDLNQLVETTLNIVQKEVSFQNIRIVKRLNHHLELVLVDRLRIQQVILNILLNASEALSGHGQITITSGQEKENVFLRIKDDGPGMLDATKQRIFDPFFSTKPVGQGTGLGMAVAYGIIQEHNGHIEINTQLGHGSTIIILLPQAD